MTENLNGAYTYLTEAIWDLVRSNSYISEIELNGPGLLFYKENGVRKVVRTQLTTAELYNEAIDGLIADAKLTKRDFLVEGRYTLRDGSFGRLHIVMPPTTQYPAVTLALKTSSLKDLTAIQQSGSFDTEISLFLKAMIATRLTTVISGGTGAGKTTFLEALTSEFDPAARVGVGEDSPELLLRNKNTVYMNSTVRSPGVDEKDIATLEWVVQQLNRMRIDLVIVGETRGKEFYDFIVGASSDKPGSLTTIHADDGNSAIRKMINFTAIALPLSPRAIAETVADAIDIVIQLGVDNRTKRHKIISINEVTNTITTGDSPTATLNPLFTYNHETGKWDKKFGTDPLKDHLKKHGYNPNTYRKLETEVVDENVGRLPAYFTRGDD